MIRGSEHQFKKPGEDWDESDKERFVACYGRVIAKAISVIVAEAKKFSFPNGGSYGYRFPKERVKEGAEVAVQCFWQRFLDPKFDDSIAGFDPEKGSALSFVSSRLLLKSISDAHKELFGYRARREASWKAPEFVHDLVDVEKEGSKKLETDFDEIKTLLFELFNLMKTDTDVEDGLSIESFFLLSYFQFGWSGDVGPTSNRFLEFSSIVEKIKFSDKLRRDDAWRRLFRVFAILGRRYWAETLEKGPRLKDPRWNGLNDLSAQKVVQYMRAYLELKLPKKDFSYIDRQGVKRQKSLKSRCAESAAGFWGDVFDKIVAWDNLQDVDERRHEL